MALDHESKAPFTQPNRPALAKVIIKAGKGAAIDCKIINKNDTILSIGSGVGYNSVILSYLCNTVIGIESIKSFYEYSSNVLTKLEVNNVVFIQSKIENGYSDQQPYDCIVIEGGVNHVPNKILNQLSENGRLVAVEIEEGVVGKANLYQRHGNEFTKNYLFDAYIPVFDCFKKTQKFIF